MPTVRIRRLPNLHPGQQAIHADPARFRIVRAGRRFGKTKLGVRECVEVGLAGGLAWWVAPSYRLAGPGWRDLRLLGAQVPYAKVHRGQRMVEFPGGGEVWVRTAADPDELRGDGLDFAVLDEAAYMQRAAWAEAIRPALADREGRALFISTLAGMVNWLADLWTQHEDDPMWGLHHQPSHTNPYLSATELEAVRDELGDLLYRQEVLAEFVELQGTLVRVEWFTYYQPIEVHSPDGSTRLLYRLPDQSVVDAEALHVFITVDPALSTKQTADYTAAAVWGITPTGKYLLLDMLRARLEAPDVIRRVGALADQWGAQWIGFEQVAYQASLIQFAKAAGLPAHGLPADKDKVSRMLPLAARLEAGDVVFPKDAPWLDELERELLLFPNGAHDDQVDALAYGVLARRAKRRNWAAK